MSVACLIYTHLYSPLSTIALKNFDRLFNVECNACALVNMRCFVLKNMPLKNNFRVAYIYWGGFTSVLTQSSRVRVFTKPVLYWLQPEARKITIIVLISHHDDGTDWLRLPPISPSIARVSTRSQLPRDQVAEIRWRRPPGTPASWLGRIGDITAAPPTPSLHLSQCASLWAQLQRSARLLLPTSGRWLMSLIELVFRARSANTTHDRVRDYSPNKSALVCA